MKAGISCICSRVAQQMTTRVHDYCAAIWALSLLTDCLRIAAQSSDWDRITAFTAAVVMLRLKVYAKKRRVRRVNMPSHCVRIQSPFSELVFPSA